jgi:hypothetical protein
MPVVPSPPTTEGRRIYDYVDVSVPMLVRMYEKPKVIERLDIKLRLLIRLNHPNTRTGILNVMNN